MIRKTGMAMSKSTVQRILKEKKPQRPPQPAGKSDDPEAVKPFCILRPKAINYTWHLDFTTVRVLFWTFKIAAIRRLLGEKC